MGETDEMAKVACEGTGVLVEADSTDGTWVGTCPSCRALVGTKPDGGKAKVLPHNLPQRARLGFVERHRLADARLLAAAFSAAGVPCDDVTWLLRRPDSLVWHLAAEKAGIGEPDGEVRRMAAELLAEAA